MKWRGRDSSFILFRIRAEEFEPYVGGADFESVNIILFDLAFGRIRTQLDSQR